MLRSHDPIIAGLTAGWIGNLAKEALTWFFFSMGWVRYTFVHIAAGFFSSTEYLDAPLSLVTGAITDWTIAGTFGVLLFYLLRYTGSNYAILKGIVSGSLMYVLTFGMALGSGVSQATSLTPLPNFLLLISHLVFGGVAGYVLERTVK